MKVSVADRTNCESLDKSVEEVVVVKVEEVVGVPNDAALDEVAAVNDGVEAIPGKPHFLEPLNQG